MQLEDYDFLSDVLLEAGPSVVNHSLLPVAKGWRCSVGGTLLIEVRILN
jgi:hypothetical protein